jgi:hypothetical protein
MRKDFGGRRLVIGDAARNRTVQSDVIAEDEMSPDTLLHHDQPAVRPDVDGNRVPLAIATNCVHEGPLGIGHRRTRSVDGCLAVAATLKRRGTAGELLGSIGSRSEACAEQKCCRKLRQGKEIALDGTIMTVNAP